MFITKKQFNELNGSVEQLKYRQWEANTNIYRRLNAQKQVLELLLPNYEEVLKYIDKKDDARKNISELKDKERLKREHELVFGSSYRKSDIRILIQHYEDIANDCDNKIKVIISGNNTSILTGEMSAF